MPQETKTTRKLRELMEKPGIIRTLGAHDVLTAVLIEQVGFETVFIGQIKSVNRRFDLIQGQEYFPK